MFGSKRRLSKADASKVRDAIGRAEKGHRGEIRVHIEHRYPGDGPLTRARDLFFRLGMAMTAQGTGVLLYVAEKDHKAAVFAGPGVYGASEPGFWKDVSRLVADGYKRGAKAEGIVAAVTKIGELLATAAPGDDTHGNELPNEVTFGQP